MGAHGLLGYQEGGRGAASCSLEVVKHMDKRSSGGYSHVNIE